MQLEPIEEQLLEVIAGLRNQGMNRVSLKQHRQRLGPLAAVEDAKLISAVQAMAAIGAIEDIDRSMQNPLTGWLISPSAPMILRQYQDEQAAIDAERNAPPDYLERWTRQARRNRTTAVIILIVLTAGPVIGLVGGIIGIVQAIRGR